MMFAVVETATGLVVDLFDAAPVITETGMVSPISAQDIRSWTHTVFETDPPVDRFLPCRMTLDDGIWSIPDQGAYDALLAQMTPPVPVPEEISDRQFFHALALQEMISEAEALAAVKTGDPPAAMEAFLTALPPEDEFNARMLLEGATTFQRSHPLTMAFGAGMGMSAAEIDDLWRMAAAL